MQPIMFENGQGPFLNGDRVPLYFVMFLLLFLRGSLIFSEVLPAQDIKDNMVIAEDGVASFNLA